MYRGKKTTDHQVEAMLADPDKYFTEARAAARIEAREYVADRMRRDWKRTNMYPVKRPSKWLPSLLTFIAIVQLGNALFSLVWAGVLGVSLSMFGFLLIFVFAYFSWKWYLDEKNTHEANAATWEAEHAREEA